MTGPTTPLHHRVLVLLLTLLLHQVASACTAEPTGHTFVYQPDRSHPAPQSVHLAGSFNGW